MPPAVRPQALALAQRVMASAGLIAPSPTISSFPSYPHTYIPRSYLPSQTPLLTPYATGFTAGSPQVLSSQSPGASAIQPHEIVSATPSSGIVLKDLLKVFSGRIGDRPGMTRKDEFIQMVKDNTSYGSDKLLRPKKQGR